MKKALILSTMAVLLAGCYTNDPYNDDYRGGTASDPVVYWDEDNAIVPPIVNTNAKFGPVNSGAEAAMPPGTSSGGTLRTRN